MPARKKKDAPKAPALPPGVRRSRRRISPALRKLLVDDTGVASGGSNLRRRISRPIATP